jgi:hypothetical protein
MIILKVFVFKNNRGKFEGLLYSIFQFVSFFIIVNVSHELSYVNSIIRAALWSTRFGKMGKQVKLIQDNYKGGI